MTRLEDPASAVAASLCVGARMPGGTGATRRHPRRCGWCDWPPAELSRMVEAFNLTAGRDERRGTWARHDVRVFTSLPRAEQEALVAATQGFEPEAAPRPPMDDGAFAPADEGWPWR